MMDVIPFVLKKLREHKSFTERFYMKKYILISLILAAIISVFSACSKDDNDDNSPVISLTGKWNVENYVIKSYENGVLQNTNTTPGNGTTFDFQTNNNLVITMPGLPVENYTYAIQPGNKVVFDGETFEIRNLTSTSVTLYIREDYAQGEYDELFINLKRP